MILQRGISLSALTIGDLKKLKENGVIAIIDGDKKVLVQAGGWAGNARVRIIDGAGNKIFPIEKRDARPQGRTEQEDPPGL